MVDSIIKVIDKNFNILLASSICVMRVLLSLVIGSPKLASIRDSTPKNPIIFLRHLLPKNLAASSLSSANTF
jgi:hypothetical protein